MLLAAGSHWDVTRAKVRAKVRAKGTKATRQTSVFGLPHTDKCERSSAACDVRGSSFAFTRYVYKYTQVHTSPRTEEHEHHEDPYREHDGDERLTAAPASVQLVAAVPDTKADEEVEALADGDEHREGLGRDAEAVDVVGPHSLLQLEPHAGGRAAREGVGDLLAATQAHLLLDVGLDVQLRLGVHVGVGDGRRAWRRLASLALRRHDLWRREKERTANNSVHEARGRGGKGQDIGEKSTVSARQHVWVRTPSVRLAIFSDVKRRSDPDPDEQYWGDSFGSAPNPCAPQRTAAGRRARALQDAGAEKLDMKGTVCVFAWTYAGWLCSPRLRCVCSQFVLEPKLNRISELP